MSHAARFYAKTTPEPNTGCLLWTGATDACGYGRFSLNGRNGSAHRIAYELSVGEIPNDLHVLHHCDIPSCVNSEHLFLGTHHDNMGDAAVKGRVRSKLSVPQVRQIKRLLRKGATDAGLGRLFGVTTNAIRLIRIGKNWRHVR